jgi:site-specific DNA-methyltransferase (adenine-specific)
MLEKFSEPFEGVTLGGTELSGNRLYHCDKEHSVFLYKGNCLELMDNLAETFPEGCFDMIFADPPYFLSNGGITCRAGRMVKVDKGKWDKSQGPNVNHEFNTAWLSRCQKVLKKDGTIWVSGTHHIIFSVGFAMQQIGMKILNDIIWEKPNPPPNLSCRYFTHATEIVIWAAKSEKSKHVFNYDLMKVMNCGKQMKSIWTFPSPSAEEKIYGKHPTQKPIALVERCILASTNNDGDLVLDPFNGSGTTAVACLRTNRRYVGIELEDEYLDVSIKRLETEISNP